MISKNQQKLIASLSHKKYRDRQGLFVAEGAKSVLELAQYFSCEMLCATANWLLENQQVKAKEKTQVTDEELKKISFLKTPQEVLAVFQKPTLYYRKEDVKNNLSLALDGVQDPGNLGTIIRIADWFGIRRVFCSADTADVFNPKTVQATMGAIGRVGVHYVDLPAFVRELRKHVPVYGTFLGGENIYAKQLPGNGIIVMGNEGNGISPEVEQLIDNKLLIPSYPVGAATSESLNVAVATAIVCSEFRRRDADF